MYVDTVACSMIHNILDSSDRDITVLSIRNAVMFYIIDSKIIK